MNINIHQVKAITTYTSSGKREDGSTFYVKRILILYLDFKGNEQRTQIDLYSDNELD